MTEKNKQADPQNETASFDKENIHLAQQVDEIIDFYKDKPDVAETEKPDDKNSPSGVFRKLPEFISGKKKDYSSADAGNEEFHETAYGLSKKNRAIIAYIIMLSVCFAVIGGSYGLALILPSNDAETERIAGELRNKKDYLLLKEEHDRVVSEINAQREIVSKKKEQADNLDNVDNIKSKLREEIAKKGQELDYYNKYHDYITNEIGDLDKKIAARAGTVAVSLPAGRYTVGKDISPGKYTIIGNCSFSAATESGESKYNTTLTSSPFEIELSNGYKLKLGGTVLFTPSL